ncbi:MAG: 3-dehydroquinate synthase II [Thermodesulfobacteriota bacterium]
MPKEFWVKLVDWDQAAGLAALEAGAQSLWLPEEAEHLAAGLGRVPLVSEDRERGFEFFDLGSAQDVERAAHAASSGRTVVVECPDWKLIPWESLVGRGRVLAVVRSLEEAEQALGVLEQGLFGVVLESRSVETIRAVGDLVGRAQPFLDLVPATITGVTATGLGDRACVDVAGMFRHGEGLLLGDWAGGLFLVAAETGENAFVAPRPFRVNAGGVHHYVLTPDLGTAYLTELTGGRTVLSVNPSGQTRAAIVGRVKIERRPLLRITAECQGVQLSLSPQNAETVNLVNPDGETISIGALQPGDEVMVHLAGSARHLGRSVEEWILER